MKKIFLTILFLFILINNSFASEGLKHFKEDFPGNDTFNHLAIGAGASALTVYYLPEKWNPWVKVGLGVLAGTLAGCISESLDEHWDNKDLAQWSMGGAMGAAGMVILFPLKFRF